MNPRGTIAVKVDMRKIEEQVLQRLAEGHPVYSAVAALPKRHPARFALLYGMGPRKLSDLAERYLSPANAVPSRKIMLECDIQCFENWQEGENREATGRLRRDGAIAYAAMEEGIAEAKPPAPRPTAVNGGPTGRLSHNPTFQFLDHHGKPTSFEGAVTGRHWAVDLETIPGPTVVVVEEEHPYPEHGILRD